MSKYGPRNERIEKMILAVDPLNMYSNEAEIAN